MSDDGRVWTEVDRIRVNIHELRNKVTELGVYFQEGRDDIEKLTNVVHNLSLKMDTFVATVTTVVTAHAAHAEACLREKQRDREIGNEHHQENKKRLDRLEAAGVKFLWAVLGLTMTALLSIALNIAKLVLPS